MKKPILNDKFAESAKRREKESAQKKVLNQDKKNGQKFFDSSYSTMLATEAVLRREWDTPEEDAAWADL